MIPTPSHPIKSWYMLFAVMIINIVIRNISKYLINLLLYGSVVMYQVENSTMDQVINRAIGRNSRDVVSRMIEMLIFSVGVVISGISDSVSSLLFISGLIGIRLMRNSSIRLVLAFFGFMIVMIRDSMMVRVIVGVIRFISTTWICTKSCGA